MTDEAVVDVPPAGVTEPVNPFEAVRNPQYTQQGSINCEVQHVVFGWIPFTAASNDSEAHGRALFAALTRGDHGAIAACPAKTAAQRKDEIAARRYTEETSGITFMGMPINTERDSQSLITGATMASVMDPTYVCNWKTPLGFVQLDAATLAAVSQAIRAHVQACFDREGVLSGLVDAGTYTDVMLNDGWP